MLTRFEPADRPGRLLVETGGVETRGVRIVAGLETVVTVYNRSHDTASDARTAERAQAEGRPFARQAAPDTRLNGRRIYKLSGARQVSFQAFQGIRLNSLVPPGPASAEARRPPSRPRKRRCLRGAVAASLNAPPPAGSGRATPASRKPAGDLRLLRPGHGYGGRLRPSQSPLSPPPIWSPMPGRPVTWVPACSWCLAGVHSRWVERRPLVGGSAPGGGSGREGGARGREGDRWSGRWR
jgi:hypothetical protein